MNKRIVEVLTLLALVAVLGSVARSRFGVESSPEEEATPIVLPNPELFTIDGVRLGMTEEEARALLQEVGSDENSGYRWTIGEGSAVDTFYIHDGKVMAVTGTKLEYGGTSYFKEGQPVAQALDRLGNIPMSYDIPGYGALCYSKIGLIVGADSKKKGVMERFTLLPLGSELEQVPYSFWSGRNPKLWVAAPLSAQVGFGVGFPDWREFEDKRTEALKGQSQAKP